MSFTQDQIDTLKEAIAEGTTRVRFGEREVYFDTLDAMRERLRMMTDEVNRANGIRPQRRRTRFLMSKGY